MTHQKVIDRLVALGLTSYEAKVFSALTRLGEAGVGEIHAVAEVPRSAVYGTLEKLERRGIIETSTGRPKKFRPLPPKAAVAKIESEVLGAVRDARAGLEELAAAPHRDASDVRIWIVRGRSRILQRLREMVGSTREELMVAGTPEHVLEFAGVWRGAKARRVKVAFACLEPEKLSQLAGVGEIIRPKYHVRIEDENPPKVLFVRSDRRTMLFASEYRDEANVEDLTAFWTDDWSLVRFLNYLTDALSPPQRKPRAGGKVRKRAAPARVRGS
ncbi:MAG: helix-turn-helix domain-containing protein [Candidatus Thermoplasmatota archaeon]